jgi:RNA polymerase sigma-70 factor (family 1)
MKEIDLVFQQYYRPLCLYALHYLHDLDEAEDVVQDCFVRLLEAEKRDANSSVSSLSMSNPQNLKSFLYASVRNACIDKLRRKNPIVQDISPSDLSGVISDEQAVDSASREAELWTAIEQLPERCREIFLMSKRDGMTYREIAEELCLSEKTVEHQISKALKTLRGKKGDFFFLLPFVLG